MQFHQGKEVWYDEEEAPADIDYRVVFFELGNDENQTVDQKRTD